MFVFGIEGALLRRAAILPEFGDIRACRERLVSGTSEHDYAYLRVIVQFGHGGGNIAPHLEADGVALIRLVQR